MSKRVVTEKIMVCCNFGNRADGLLLEFKVKRLVYICLSSSVFRVHLTSSLSCMKSFFLTRLLPILTLVLAFGETLLAQPGSGGPTPADTPTVTPIDGGVSLLLAGGVAYGIKHLRSRRKKA
ncbi:MAG: hypothetical protein NVS3B25_24660 [Hymenobacter sp.]